MIIKIDQLLDEKEELILKDFLNCKEVEVYTSKVIYEEEDCFHLFSPSEIVIKINNRIVKISDFSLWQSVEFSSHHINIFYIDKIPLDFTLNSKIIHSIDQVNIYKLEDFGVYNSPEVLQKFLPLPGMIDASKECILNYSTIAFLEFKSNSQFVFGIEVNDGWGDSSIAFHKSEPTVQRYKKIMDKEFLAISIYKTLQS